MINKPFIYMGDKGRFYKEIREIFKKSEKKVYVDLFAGGLTVPINLKNDIKDIKVIANVKDAGVEALINRKDRLEIYKNTVEYIVQNKIENLTKDSITEDWENRKERYKNYLTTKNEEEKNLITLLCSFNRGSSLGARYYSLLKVEKIEKYINAVKMLDVVTTYIFNKNWIFKNAFILLDPPYLCSTQTGKKIKNGYNYSKQLTWTEKNDEELVFFIKNNLKNNNVFMIFGSLENNLSKLIRKEFKNVEFIVKKYKKNIFGKVSERAEWYCLIK